MSNIYNLEGSRVSKIYRYIFTLHEGRVYYFRLSGGQVVTAYPLEDTGFTIVDGYIHHADALDWQSNLNKYLQHKKFLQRSLTEVLDETPTAESLIVDYFEFYLAKEVLEKVAGVFEREIFSE